MHKGRSQSKFEQHREHIGRGVRGHNVVDFFNVLTGPVLRRELTLARLYHSGV